MAVETLESTDAGQVLEAEHTAATGLPQLNFETFPSQIFWLIVAFIVLYFLLDKVALPRISTILEERADAITDDLDRAEEFRRKAEVAEEQYQQALRDARAKAQEIAAENRARIQKEVDAATARADAEISAKAAESEGRIREIRDSAMESVEEVARETALAVVEAVLPEAADKQTVDQAVQQRL